MATTIKTHVSELAAAAATLIGLMVYLVNSTTGYMAGQGLSALVIALSVVAIVALAARAFAGNRLPAVLNDVLLIGAEVLLLVSFAQFVLERVRLAAGIGADLAQCRTDRCGMLPRGHPPARRQGVHRQGRTTYGGHAGTGRRITTICRSHGRHHHQAIRRRAPIAVIAIRKDVAGGHAIRCNFRGDFRNHHAGSRFQCRLGLSPS